MTVAELLGRMSARELAEWRAFARVESEEHERGQMDSRAASRVSAMRRR